MGMTNEQYQSVIRLIAKLVEKISNEDDAKETAELIRQLLPKDKDKE